MPSSTTTIRLARQHDLAQLVTLSIGIQSLHAQGRPDLFREPDETALRTFLEARLDDDSVLLVAEADGALQGYLLAEIQTREANPFRHASVTLYVHQVAVAPDSQNRGIGSELLAASTTIARDNAATTVRLDSWAFNSDAHRFFESQGFAALNLVFERALGS